MPTMKASLHFKDEKGEHGGRAASGGSGGTRQQPGDAKKPEKEEGEIERKSPARPSGEASGGEPEASTSLRDEAEGIGASEKDLADFRASDLGVGTLLGARKVPGSIAMEMFLQDSGRPRKEVALEYLAVYEGLPPQ